MPNKRVVIVAAVNGGMQQDRDGAKVPVTPEQIADDALACFEAGASILHFHARDAQGKNSGDPAIYRETIQRIREKCPILIQTTNGIGLRKDLVTGQMVWPSDEERLALLNLDPAPDLYGIAAGSTDFYHPEGGYKEETPYVNSPSFLRTTLSHVFNKLHSTVEFELVDINVVHRLKRFADEGLFDANASNLWALHAGGLSNKPATARSLVYSRDEQQRLFPNAKWGVMGGGRANFTFVAHGLAMDCDTVRVGYEDGIHLPNGDVAPRNHNLVEAMVKLAQSLGREPASTQETRALFQLKPR